MITFFHQSAGISGDPRISNHAEPLMLARLPLTGLSTPHLDLEADIGSLAVQVARRFLIGIRMVSEALCRSPAAPQTGEQRIFASFGREDHISLRGRTLLQLHRFGTNDKVWYAGPRGFGTIPSLGEKAGVLIIYCADGLRRLLRLGLCRRRRSVCRNGSEHLGLFRKSRTSLWF